MRFIYKYIEIRELYEKSHLIIKKDKEGKIISSDIKFITTDIKYDIKDFAYSLYKNEYELKRYNYSNSYVYEFIREIGLPEKNKETFVISSQKINECFKRYFNDYVQYKSVRTRARNVKCYVFECSYDELLEFYKSSGFVIDSEYEKLKDNYNVLEYCDCIDYQPSNNNYYNSDCDQINELKQKLNEQDNLLKKYDEELKEKDKTIEKLEIFKNEYIYKITEQLNKEIEKLKNQNLDLQEKINEYEKQLQKFNQLKDLLKDLIN